jgi:hypothetical protein
LFNLQDAAVLAMAADVQGALRSWWLPERVASLATALFMGYCRLTVSAWQPFLVLEDRFHDCDIAAFVLDCLCDFAMRLTCKNPSFLPKPACVPKSCSGFAWSIALEA